VPQVPTPERVTLTSNLLADVAGPPDSDARNRLYRRPHIVSASSG
jgi:hypothetical protein